MSRDASRRRRVRTLKLVSRDSSAVSISSLSQTDVEGVSKPWRGGELGKWMASLGMGHLPVRSCPVGQDSFDGRKVKEKLAANPQARQPSRKGLVAEPLPW